MNTRHYTYRVTWSPEYGKHVGLLTEFCVRIPSMVHRNLALMATQGVSLNRLASAKLTA